MQVSSQSIRFLEDLILKHQELAQLFTDLSESCSRPKVMVARKSEAAQIQQVPQKVCEPDGLV